MLRIVLVLMPFAWIAGAAAQHIGGYSAPGSVMNAPPTPEWAKALRNCPCTAPGKNLGDGWAILPPLIPNATSDTVTCYRSYLTVNERAVRAGQNCCYDRTGALYNQGPLAGLPDKVGTGMGEEADGTVILDPDLLDAHRIEDLLPREQAAAMPNGWLERQRLHPPNRGARCKTNGALPAIIEAERKRMLDPHQGPAKR
jgi:hypothetical protein